MNDSIHAQLATGDVTALLTSASPDEVRVIAFAKLDGDTVTMTSVRFAGTVYGIVSEPGENTPMIVETHATAECASASMTRAWDTVRREYTLAQSFGILPADGMRETHTLAGVDMLPATAPVADTMPAGTWSTV
jgi:hypothetical protein